MMNEAKRLLNEKRAKEIMKANNLAALIATMPENVSYVSNYMSNVTYNYRGQKVFAVYTAEGDTTLIVPHSELAYVTDRKPMTEDIRTYGTFYLGRDKDNALGELENKVLSALEKQKMGVGAVALLIQCLKEKKLDRAVIGWDTGNISSPAVLTELQREFPQSTFVDAFNLFRQIRMVKTPAELEIIRKAIAINEKGLGAVFAAVAAGVSEDELFRAFQTAIAAEGAQLGFWSGGAGKRSAFLCEPSGYRMQKGDHLRFDAGAIYQHYWSDMGRTAVLGEPSAKLARLYECIKSGYTAALPLLKSGARPSALFRAMDETIRNNGIPGYQRHHLGHSTGIEFYEPPMVVPNDKPSDIFLAGSEEMLLSENMIVNLEVPYYEAGFGGLQLEDTFLITKGGYEKLTTYPTGLYVAQTK